MVIIISGVIYEHSIVFKNIKTLQDSFRAIHSRFCK